MSHTISHLGLTDGEKKLQADVRHFADTVVAPAAYEYDTKRELPYDIIAQMGEMGLFGLPFPKEFGGQGKDYVSLCLAVEELARVDQSIAVTLEAGLGLGAMPIFKQGTEAQKQQWLPMLARGEALAGFGLTEADAGSDAAGRPGRWRMGHQRYEAVHYELREQDHQGGYGDRCDGSPREWQA
jgi:short/branched chain acyl-CoA dehydrogenase